MEDVKWELLLFDGDLILFVLFSPLSMQMKEYTQEKQHSSLTGIITGLVFVSYITLDL